MEALLGIMQMVHDASPEGKVSIIVALIALAGVVISGILKLIGVCIGIYPQLKKLEQKDVDNQPSGINKSPVVPSTESDDSISEHKAPQNFQLPPKETPSEHKAGEVKMFALPGGVELEMVWCPAGRFTMGSPDGKSEYPLSSGIDPKAELGRYNNEAPHEVTLTKGFWIGKYPVTQIQYKAITGENPSYFKGNNRPVENVIWNSSVAFCERLNELKIAPEGYRFALPTEAQWEYACRAETTTALNNEKPITSENGECPNLDEVGWYGKNSEGKTHLVGEKRPNAWGIYDMHGNVWEWCRDYSIPRPVNSVWLAVTDTYRDGIEDPLCKKGGHRVLRGGSWNGSAGLCRSAHRSDEAPDFCYYNYGFRLALVPE